MTEYKLTNRGKFVLGLIILSFVIIIVYSGSYIINYFSTNEPVEVITPTELTEASEETTGNETDTTEATEATEVTELTEDAESTSETIYSLSELEDLKQFKVIITFKENDSKIQLSDAVELDSVRAMMVQYPSEKLSIDGHVNGYPKYKTDKASDALSLERALSVERALIDLGIDKKLISVYNFGSEAPLYKDFGNQSKNDRVEIYFMDHYIKGSRGK